MSTNANRRDAGSNRLSLGSYVPDSIEGTPARQRWCNRVSAAVLEAADACDKAAGIYRVSLDAAIEEAAKEFCRIHLGDVWDSITEPARDGYRDYFRGVLTAAVMGGAQ